ncbi:MAG: beta-ketoacyl-ACP synthase [Alphaproteobacteria bacterium]|nr:beta-ketoacyl-ACP synthase [Alphaproteobacteria bacterium]
MRRVVVTGMAGITSLGDSWPAIREAMHAGRTGVKYISDWDRLTDLGTRLGSPADWFQHEGAYKRQAMRSMGRVSVMAVKAAEAALAQAGLTDDPILKTGRSGVACGSSYGSTPPTVDFVRFLDTGKAGALNATSYIRMMSHTSPVNLAVFFGLQGRVITTSSACTSGSQGIGSAFEAIQANRADVMVCGGAEEFCPTMTMVFDRLYATSNRNNDPDTAVRPFDQSRDGLVIGEGTGILILEEREHALARGATPLAEIAGFATNCDGSHISQPSQATQIDVMRLALESAGIDAGAIDFISGHGTGTVTGDVVESQASAEVYGKKTPFHTLKGHFGHTLGACGGIEAWLGIEMMNEGLLTATANLHNVDPKCADLDYVMEAPRKVDAEYFVSNNFAFGGINTSLVVRRAA